jgi:glycosyltransferase involved in cell wall biosynthesis
MTRRLLVLVPFTPRCDAVHGGSRAIAGLLTVLASRHRVAVIHLRGSNEPPMDDALSSKCDLVREVRHLHPFGFRRATRRLRVGLAAAAGRPFWVGWWRVPAFARCVREVAASWRPDVVQIEFHLMGQYIPALRECSAPRVLVNHDPGVTIADTARGVRRAMGFGQRLLLSLDASAWRRYESRIARQVQAIVVFTERDRATLTPLAGRTPIVRIPLGTALPELPSNAVGSDPATLLFVGSFRHLPNLDAAERLVNTIVPDVLRRRPNVKLVLIGSDVPAALQQRAGPHLEIAGTVSDLGPYLDRASLVAIPLRLGGGMRVKVLEAMAAGKAIVATPLAVEGLDVRDGREVAIADSDDEFSRRIVSLLADTGQRARLGTNARIWAGDHLQWPVIADRFEQLYSGLLPEEPQRP